MPPGKVPWELISRHLASVMPPEVELGPACGEDAALVRIGGQLWAVASDPVSFTSHDAGRLTVQVNANDIAVRGARPTLMTVVMLIAPGEADEASIGALLDEIVAACQQLGVTLIGGHTEVTPGLSHGVIVGTMLGPVQERAIVTGGLAPGDHVGFAGWAGLEGTAILLARFGERVASPVPVEELTQVNAILEADWISVVEPALALAAVPGVVALHDVTEGGVGEALHELGAASGCAIDADPGAIPILESTRHVCRLFGMDPLGLIGSGGLLIGCCQSSKPEVEAVLTRLGVPLAWIGEAREGQPGCATVPRFPRDEILRADALDGIRAVLFDMDGTLIDSPYDWPAIRRALGVEGPSLIDGIEALPAGKRQRAWAELEAIERDATQRATLKPGVHDLLAALAARRFGTALVTNNTWANTSILLEKFGLAFDVVLTRDSGLYKPSGAPLVEACSRLGVDPEACLAVGDSRYDLEAARDAGCGSVCIVHERTAELRDEVDLALSDLAALTKVLEIVLPPAPS